MQRCVEEPDCLALNYSPYDKTCEMTSVLFGDTGIGAFQNSGGEYLEKVHPLIAQAL